MNKDIFFTVRIDERMKAALEAAAAANDTRPRPLAAEFLSESLQKLGYLPKKERRAAQQLQEVAQA